MYQCEPTTLGVADATGITITYPGPCRIAYTCPFALDLAAAYFDAFPVEPARADGQQQDANRELGSHPV